MKRLYPSHRLAVRDALLFDIGEPEFVEQCKQDARNRAKLCHKTSLRDPEVSKRNLQALADSKAGKTNTLIFEVTEHG